MQESVVAKVSLYPRSGWDHYILTALNVKGQCTLKNLKGEILKTKVNVSQLKPYYPCQDIGTNI